MDGPHSENCRYSKPTVILIFYPLTSNQSNNSNQIEPMRFYVMFFSDKKCVLSITNDKKLKNNNVSSL